MRVPVVLPGLHTYSLDFTSGNWNSAPYSLGARNAFFDYKTADGLVIEEFVGMDTFKDYSIPGEPLACSDVLPRLELILILGMKWYLRKSKTALLLNTLCRCG